MIERPKRESSGPPNVGVRLIKCGQASEGRERVLIDLDFGVGRGERVKRGDDGGTPPPTRSVQRPPAVHEPLTCGVREAVHRDEGESVHRAIRVRGAVGKKVEHGRFIRWIQFQQSAGRDDPAVEIKGGVRQDTFVDLLGLRVVLKGDRDPGILLTFGGPLFEGRCQMNTGAGCQEPGR